MRLRRHLAALCGLVLALSAVVGSASAAPAGDAAPCLRMGASQVAGVSVPTCVRFHARGAAIRLPDDTERVVYGLWDGRGLLTRTGELPVAGSGWDALTTTPGLFLRARVQGGTAVAPRAALLVRESAVLAPLAGTQATVLVSWVSPPDGVHDGRGLLQFTSRRAALMANVHHGVRVDGRCLPALAATSAERAAYEPFFPGGTLGLSWLAGMHAPVDSEIVLQSPGGPSWMTRGPALIDLLSEPWRPTSVEFLIHANPMGTPASLTGPLSPMTAAARCAL